MTVDELIAYLQEGKKQKQWKGTEQVVIPYFDPDTVYEIVKDAKVKKAGKKTYPNAYSQELTDDKGKPLQNTKSVVCFNYD